jgi:hypothetical protein|tara:strand:- start:164 stop:490 length:327 start_codon:yes stop_codon:yes gene_type:complete
VYQIALDINDMEVEWTLGSVISVSPGPGAAGASSGGSSTIFDVFLIFFCIFATLLVAVLCIKMMLSPRKVGGKTSSSVGADSTSGMFSRLLSIGASAKTAVLLQFVNP